MNDTTEFIEKFIAPIMSPGIKKMLLEKLHWDKRTLEFALKIDDTGIKSNAPSLYLNIAKCYEIQVTLVRRKAIIGLPCLLKATRRMMDMPDDKIRD